MSRKCNGDSPPPDIPDFSEILSWRNIPPRYLTTDEIIEVFGVNYEIPSDLYSDLREDLGYKKVLSWMSKTGVLSRIRCNDMTVNWSNGLLSDVIWRKLFMKDFGEPFHPIETHILVRTLRRKGYIVKDRKDALGFIWKGNLCVRKMMHVAKSNFNPKEKSRGLMLNLHENARDGLGNKWPNVMEHDVSSDSDDDGKCGDAIEGDRLCVSNNSDRVFSKHLHSNMYLVGSWYSLYNARLTYEHNLTRTPIDGEIITEMADYIIHRYPTSYCVWRRGHVMHIIDAHKHGVHRW